MSSPTLAGLTVSKRIGSPRASWTTSCSPLAPPSVVVLGLLQPGQALVLGADGADHLRGQLALGIEAAAVGQRRDAVDVQLLDPVGLVEADLLGEVGEAGLGVGERLLEARGGLPGRIAASRSAVPAGSLTWYGVAITVAASSETASTLPLRSSTRPRSPGTVDRRHLLAAGVGAQLAAAHPLQPGGARERHAEQQHEDAEDQAQAPVDQPHGASATGPRGRRLRWAGARGRRGRRRRGAGAAACCGGAVDGAAAARAGRHRRRRLDRGRRRRDRPRSPRS